MGTPAWLNRKKEIPSDVLTLIDTSKANGCWIYYEKKQQFYTPQEFEQNWSSVVKSDGKLNNFKEFKIVNPMYAVRLTARWLNIANQKNQEILKKLESYSGDFKLKS